MISRALGIAALIVVLVGLVMLWLESREQAAVQNERRERMSDAIELIRESDKQLDVVRKASDADLCRVLGGTTVDGVCQ